MLLLRTWAIWGRSRTILIGLCLLLVVSDLYHDVTLRCNPCIQLCMVAAAGSALYLSLTVISELLTFS
jgi:hypothetical protein